MVRTNHPMGVPKLLRGYLHGRITQRSKALRTKRLHRRQNPSFPASGTKVDQPKGATKTVAPLATLGH